MKWRKTEAMQTPEEEESSRKSPGVEADDLNEAGLRRKVERRSKVPGKTRESKNTSKVMEEENKSG